MIVTDLRHCHARAGGGGPQALAKGAAKKAAKGEKLDARQIKIKAAVLARKSKFQVHGAVAGLGLGLGQGRLDCPQHRPPLTNHAHLLCETICPWRTKSWGWGWGAVGSHVLETVA